MYFKFWQMTRKRRLDCNLHIFKSQKKRINGVYNISYFLLFFTFFFILNLHLGSWGKSRKETTKGLGFENAFRCLGPDPELRFGKSPTEEKNNDSEARKISPSFLLRILSCSNWIKKAKS